MSWFIAESDAAGVGSIRTRYEVETKIDLKGEVLFPDVPQPVTSCHPGYRLRRCPTMETRFTFHPTSGSVPLAAAALGSCR